MKNRVLLLTIHSFGCLAFLALPYFFTSGGFARLAEVNQNPHEQRNLASYLLILGFFYANYYGLIPWLFFRKRYFWYGLSLLAVLSLMQYTLVQINQRADRPPAFLPFPQRPAPLPEGASPGLRLSPAPGPPPRLPGDYKALSHEAPPGQPPGTDFEQASFPVEASQTFFLFLVSFLLSLTLRLNNRWRETERAKLQTELSYLKAQINPHFLFNTLNSIYSLAIEQSVHTAPAIIELSSFLRYITEENYQDRVMLTKELDYIGHYVALQKLRLADTVQIRFSISGTAQGQRIAPLILISFIENAFKYGVNPEETSLIIVGISIQEDELRGHVFNKKVHIAHGLQTAGSGIGLANTKARLQLLYPDKHQLAIRDTPEDFTVDLVLTLS